MVPLLRAANESKDKQHLREKHSQGRKDKEGQGHDKNSQHNSQWVQHILGRPFTSILFILTLRRVLRMTFKTRQRRSFAGHASPTRKTALDKTERCH